MGVASSFGQLSAGLALSASLVCAMNSPQPLNGRLSRCSPGSEPLIPSGPGHRRNDDYSSLVRGGPGIQAKPALPQPGMDLP
jgi:hypothetical protein